MEKNTIFNEQPVPNFFASKRTCKRPVTALAYSTISTWRRTGSTITRLSNEAPILVETGVALRVGDTGVALRGDEKAPRKLRP